ncbi:MAG: hypothetical protein QNL04_06195 [SAR324 cluster bacterium]|nr:hypothetical protein [SAR324 cluster bacterium]
MKNALKNTKNLLTISFMLILILAGCQEPEAEVAETTPTVDLNVAVAVVGTEATANDRTASIVGEAVSQILYPDGSNTEIDQPSMAFLGAATDIDRVEVTVTEGLVNLITSQPLTYSLTSYSAILPSLPIGSEIVITAKGLDITGKEIYNGNQTVTLVGTETTLAINLNPIDDGKLNTLPVVTAVTTPTEIERVLTGDVSITIAGAIGDSFECQFLPDANGGYYTPSVINVTLGATTGTCDSTFTAPDVKGFVSHEFIVTNSQSNSTTIGYDLNIVNAKKDVGVTVGIAPSIDSLAAKVTKKGVTLTANVSDDQPTNKLCYSWVYNGSTTAFKDATKNPASFTGYDRTVGGQLVLTIRDENCTGLSTSATFEIAVGQWPVL